MICLRCFGLGWFGFALADLFVLALRSVYGGLCCCLVVLVMSLAG